MGGLQWFDNICRLLALSLPLSISLKLNITQYFLQNKSNLVELKRKMLLCKLQDNSKLFRFIEQILLTNIE